MTGSEDAESVETTCNNDDSRMLFVEREVVILPKGRSRNAKAEKNTLQAGATTGNDILLHKPDLKRNAVKNQQTPAKQIGRETAGQLLRLTVRLTDRVLE